jgi:hypothetical protein
VNLWRTSAKTTFVVLRHLVEINAPHMDTQAAPVGEIDQEAMCAAAAREEHPAHACTPSEARCFHRQVAAARAILERAFAETLALRAALPQADSSS